MGVSLVNPTGPNFIKDFPSQNEVNCNSIDDYAAPCLTSHPLQTYTPALTAVTTNPVLGTAGFINGYYYEIFDQIYSWGEFRFGTAGINVGSGIYIITLPFPAKSIIGFTSSLLGDTLVLGNGVVWRNASSVGRMPLSAHLRSSTTLNFGYRMDSGLPLREMGENSPISWAINDGISWAVRYKRDA